MDFAAHISSLDITLIHITKIHTSICKATNKILGQKMVFVVFASTIIDNILFFSSDLLTNYCVRKSKYCSSRWMQVYSKFCISFASFLFPTYPWLHFLDGQRDT